LQLLSSAQHLGDAKIVEGTKGHTQNKPPSIHTDPLKALPCNSRLKNFFHLIVCHHTPSNIISKMKYLVSDDLRDKIRKKFQLNVSFMRFRVDILETF
jgi:hypothetical protein